LADHDNTARGQAAFALAASGSPAVPQLIDALNNHSPYVSAAEEPVAGALTYALLGQRRGAGLTARVAVM
jgi:hypothetical protein